MNRISFNLLWEILEFDIRTLFIIESMSHYLERILKNHPEKIRRFWKNSFPRENVKHLKYSECKEIIIKRLYSRFIASINPNTNWLTICNIKSGHFWHCENYAFSKRDASYIFISNRKLLLFLAGGWKSILGRASRKSFIYNARSSDL